MTVFNVTTSIDSISLPPKLFLFGLAGAGKTWIGRLLRDRLGYYLYEADMDHTPAMADAIARKISFTDDMRDEFFAQIAEKIRDLSHQHEKLVITQAAYKERNRLWLIAQFPDLEMVCIRAPWELVIERLKRRKDWVGSQYAQQIAVNFEEPGDHYPSIYNDADSERMFSQLKSVF